MATCFTPTLLDPGTGAGLVERPEAMLSEDPGTTWLETGPDGSSPVVTLDFGRKRTGYLRLETVGAGQDFLHLEYGPLADLLPKVRTFRLPPSGEAWTDDSYIACRYLRLSLRAADPGSGPVRAGLRRIGLVDSAYPCALQGSFESGDPVLDRIWETGAYTVRICMQPSTQSSEYHFSRLPEPFQRFIREWRSEYSPYVLFDGPRRDREVWLGDLRTEALAVYSAFDAADVVKSSLDVFLALQREDGTTVGCAGTRQEFKEYNLWWVIAIWECYLHTGDEAFLAHMLPGVRRFLDWLLAATAETGLLHNDGNWMWTLPREGYSSATQCILVETFRCAARIEAASGAPRTAEDLTRRADALRERIRRTWWNEEKGVFDDELRLVEADPTVLSDVNCYAVTFGIADAAQGARILSYLRERMWTPYGSATLDRRIEKARLQSGLKSYGLLHFLRNDPDPSARVVEFMYPHNRMIWPFMVAYEVEARFLAGDTEGAFELIRRCWGHLLDGGTGTFWECVDAETGAFPMRSFIPGSDIDCFNSAAHGWSGWISWILSAYVLGVRPLEPGFRKVLVSPDPGSLPSVRGEVPTPRGPIRVRVANGSDELRIEVEAPEGVEVVKAATPSVLRGRRLS